MTRPTAEELRAAFADVAPGEYRTPELLPVYAAWAEREGKSVPSVKLLGEAMAHGMCLDKRRGHGNVTVWIVTRAGLDCRNWFTET